MTATFVLGHRPKHTCDGPGEKAAALFIVKNGKIVHWAARPGAEAEPPGDLVLVEAAAGLAAEAARRT